jgi:Fe-S cluster assembly ATP-binding protein
MTINALRAPERSACCLITHYERLLEYVKPRPHPCAGRRAASWIQAGPNSRQKLEAEGYDRYLKAAA